MKKFALAKSFLLVSLLFFSACGNSELSIVVIPKLTGISYYDVVYQGVKQAAAELDDLNVRWMGTEEAKVEQQIELIGSIIPDRPDAVCVASNDDLAIAPILKKAAGAGISVISWDGDAAYRDFFVNLVDYREFGRGLADAVAEYAGEDTALAIITTTFTAPNQVLWLEVVQERLAEKYPGINILDIRPAGESSEEAYAVAMEYIHSMPELDALMVLGVPNVPGAAKAVEETGNTGKIVLVGNATPNLVRDYVHKGVIQAALLWDAPAHGYLTVYSTYMFLKGKIQEGIPFSAGSLGSFTPVRDGVSLQVSLPLLKFTRENIDNYNF